MLELPSCGARNLFHRFEFHLQAGTDHFLHLLSQSLRVEGLSVTKRYPDHDLAQSLLNHLCLPNLVGILEQVAEPHDTSTLRGQYVILVSSINGKNHPGVASARATITCRRPDGPITDVVTNERKCMIGKHCCDNLPAQAAVGKHFRLNALKNPEFPVFVIVTVLTPGRVTAPFGKPVLIAHG